MALGGCRQVFCSGGESSVEVRRAGCRRQRRHPDPIITMLRCFPWIVVCLSLPGMGSWGSASDHAPLIANLIPLFA